MLPMSASGGRMHEQRPYPLKSGLRDAHAVLGVLAELKQQGGIRRGVVGLAVSAQRKRGQGGEQILHRAAAGLSGHLDLCDGVFSPPL